jgi:hypothetical protein
LGGACAAVRACQQLFARIAEAIPNDIFIRSYSKRTLPINQTRFQNTHQTDPMPDFGLFQLLMIAVAVAGVIFSAIVHGRYESSKDLLACPSGMSPERWRKYGQCARIQAAATVGMWFFLVVTFVAVTTLFGASIRF